MDSQGIGKRLQMLRKRANLSVDELASLIGKDRATVYRYERGDIRKLPFELLEPLARAFNVTPADVIGLVNEDDLILSVEEKKLVLAYRNQPNMKDAINRILGINEEPLIVVNTPQDQPPRIMNTKKSVPQVQQPQDEFIEVRYSARPMDLTDKDTSGTMLINRSKLAQAEVEDYSEYD